MDANLHRRRSFALELFTFCDLQRKFFHDSWGKAMLFTFLVATVTPLTNGHDQQRPAIEEALDQLPQTP